MRTIPPSKPFAVAITDFLLLLALLGPHAVLCQQGNSPEEDLSLDQVPGAFLDDADDYAESAKVPELHHTDRADDSPPTTDLANGDRELGVSLPATEQRTSIYKKTESSAAPTFQPLGSIRGSRRARDAAARSLLPISY